MSRLHLVPALAPADVRDAFAETAAGALALAAALLEQHPVTSPDVPRAREHVQEALRALQQLEAQLALMGDDSEAFRAALARRGGL